MPRQKGDKGRRIEWFSIKTDYMSCEDSIAKVLKKHDVGQSGGLNIHNHTRGWIDERKKLHNRILERLKTKVVNASVKEWDRQLKLWLKVEDRAKDILEAKKKKPTAKDVANLSIALEKALKSQRLIAGESTENLKSTSLHLQLIQLSKKINQGEIIDDIPEEIEAKIVATSESLQD